MTRKKPIALPDVSESDVMPTEHDSVLTGQSVLIDEIKETADKLGRDNGPPQIRNVEFG